MGVDTLYASCGVLPVTSNYKPTLQLFYRRATPIGFAKVGWNASTRALVRTEALALRAMPASASDHPLVPGLKTTLEWGDRTVTVV